MLIEISDFARMFLAGQLLLCIFTSVFGVAALKAEISRAPKIISYAEKTILMAGGVSVVVLLLAGISFLRDDFSIVMVSRYGGSDLAWPYKLSAVWAGHEGSLLLWSTFQLVLFILWRISFRTKDIHFNALSLAIGSAVCFCFSALLVFIAKPFAQTMITIEGEAGLNPLLRNFWMLSHPPLLFIGYSALMIPFVAIISAVFADKTEITGLYSQVRRWLLIGIVFLGLGIATGAKWSYIELGWGGYWAWDPVENASLLPWLLAVAALHSLVGLKISPKFGFWSVFLLPLPFIMCLVATFITRSGVLQSVHAFDENVIFGALLAFIISCVILWLLSNILAAKSTGVISPKLGTPILDRVGLLFWTILVLFFFTLAIGVATFWPAISHFASGSGPAVIITRKFYDLMASAAGTILAFLVGLSMLAVLKRRSAYILQILGSSAAGLITYALIFKFLNTSFSVAIACGVCMFSLIAAFIDLCSKSRTSSIGGLLSHLGLLLMVVAAGFAADSKIIQMSLEKGDVFPLRAYSISYESFEHKLLEDATRVGPILSLSREDFQKTLWPYTCIYAQGKSTSEVAVHTGLFEDVYISFDGMDDDGKVVVTAQAKPLMSWLWVSFILIAAGPTLAIFTGKRAGK